MPTILSLKPLAAPVRMPARQDPAWFSPLNRALLRLVETVELWIARRAQRRDLLALPDHLMHDIGRSRADVEAEAMKRFWQG